MLIILNQILKVRLNIYVLNIVQIFHLCLVLLLLLIILMNVFKLAALMIKEIISKYSMVKLKDNVLKIFNVKKIKELYKNIINSVLINVHNGIL